MDARSQWNFKIVFVCIFSCIFSLVSFSGCEINGSKRETRTQDSIIVSLTTSNQYATNHSAYQELFPTVQSFSAAADSASSMSLQVSPPEGCYSTAALNQAIWNQMMLQRFFDVGKVQLRTSSGKTVRLTKREDNYYYSFTPIPPGKTRLTAEGIKNGSLKSKTDFSVLSAEADIAIFEVNERGEELARYDMVTPEVPTANDRIVLKKNGINLVAYNAPSGTDFVKVTVDDGGNQPDGSMTCFSSPEKVVLLPPDGLKLMRSTAQAKIQIEFISVKEIKDVSRLKIGHVLSSMIHMQGTIVYKVNDETQTDTFGVVEIQ